jgi:hypothetical protein
MKPAQSEVNAWQSWLRAMADVLQSAYLRDQGILVELRLPLTSKRRSSRGERVDRQRGVRLRAGGRSHAQPGQILFMERLLEP